MGLAEDMYECWLAHRGSEYCTIGPRSERNGYTEDECRRMWMVSPRNAARLLNPALFSNEFIDMVACPAHHERALHEWGERRGR